MPWSITKPGIRYHELRQQIRSFDLLFFKGKGLPSNLIACSQKCVMHIPPERSFTHVGICIQGTMFPPTSRYYSPTAIYVMESTQGGYKVPCCGGIGGDGAPSLSTVADGEFTGAQLRDLDAVVASYDTSSSTYLAYAPLNPASRTIADQVTPEVWEKTFQKYNRTPYSFSLLTLCGALLPCLRPLRDSRPGYDYAKCISCLCFCTPDYHRWIFCSQMVENILIDLGIQTKKDVSTQGRNVVPDDFFVETSARPIIVDPPVRYTLYYPPLVKM